MIKIVNTLNEVEKQKKSVIDFYAPWCGPCKRIAGDYDKLAETYPNINFYKCDVDDENQDLATDFDVGALPTFILIDSTDKVVNKIEGANVSVLTSAIESLNNLVNEETEGLTEQSQGLKKCISKACCECAEDCDANKVCEEENCECIEKKD